MAIDLAELADKKREVRKRRAVPNGSQVIPKRSQMPPFVPKRFPNDSQMVPNPFFNQLPLKHMPFFREIAKSRDQSFFRDSAKLAGGRIPPPPGRRPKKQTAKRRVPGCVLARPWVNPGFILGAFWPLCRVRPARHNPWKTGEFREFKKHEEKSQPKTTS